MGRCDRFMVVEVTPPALSEPSPASDEHCQKPEISVTLISSGVTHSFLSRPAHATASECHLAETTAGTKETGKETTGTGTAILAVVEVEAAEDTETNQDGGQVVRVVHAVPINEV